MHLILIVLLPCLLLGCTRSEPCVAEAHMSFSWKPDSEPAKSGKMITPVMRQRLTSILNNKELIDSILQGAPLPISGGLVDWESLSDRLEVSQIGEGTVVKPEIMLRLRHADKNYALYVVRSIGEKIVKFYYADVPDDKELVGKFIAEPSFECSASGS